MSAITVRIDDDVKRQFDRTAGDLGMSSSMAINVFVRKFVAYGGFPFDVRLERPMGPTGLADWSSAYVPKAGSTGAPVLPADWDDECDGVYDDMLS